MTLALAQRRWVVFGAGGMLGAELINLLQAKHLPALALSRADADITDLKAVRSFIGVDDIVVNCAAWTRVDDAELHRDEAFAINADGARNVAQACAEVGAKLVHISTDYVFGDAPAGVPIPEDAPVSPRCVYGESKAAGERAVLDVLGDQANIVRTAWLYGAYGPNFVTSMRTRLASGHDLRVVDDQIGQPTWARDVATFVHRVMAHGATGIFHATSQGQCSWYELTCAIAELDGYECSQIHPVSTREYPTRAVRPQWSVLAHTAYIVEIRPWREALAEFLRSATSN